MYFIKKKKKKAYAAKKAGGNLVTFYHGLHLKGSGLK